MANRHTRAMLMAGAATLSLSAAAWASEFSNVFVFGDRFLDAGQFVDSRTVFPDDPDEEITTDGRGRFTNLQADGSTGHTWSTLVSRTLGNGDTNPNQPQSLSNSPPFKTGTNYAAGFYDTFDILQSINGTPVINGIVYRNGGVERRVAGTIGTGILNDDEKRGWLASSVVLMNGGARDIRSLADIDRFLDGTIDLDNTDVVGNPYEREAIALRGAERIAEGAVLLRDAGAGLVVVSNLIDMGAIPETPGDSALAEDALDTLDEVLSKRRSTNPAAQFTAAEFQQRLELLAILDDPDLIANIRTDGTNVFNARLAQQLDGQTGVVLIDQNALYAEMLAKPEKFGLASNVNHGVDCRFSSVLYPCAENDSAPLSEQIFSDGLDLSTTAHAMFAQHVASVINAPVQVSGLPYTAMASGREVANAGRAQMSPERIARKGWAPFVSAGIGSSTWNDISGEGAHGSMRLSGVAGVTYSLGNGIAVGAGAGYQNTTRASSGTTIETEGSGVYGTVFAGADVGHVFGNASVTLGSIEYDRVARQTRIGAASYENGGGTDASVFGASIEVGVRALTSGMIAAGPIASIDHWSSNVDGYKEDGWKVTAVDFDDIEGSSTRASLGLFLQGGDLNYEDMPAVFRVKALYTRELDSDPNRVTARTHTQPGNSFSREGRGAQEDSMTVGAQLTYDFGPVIASLNYDVRIGEADDHSGSIDISMPFGGE